MVKFKSSLVIGLAILFMVPGMALAKTHTQISGTIQGASDVINHTVPPINGKDLNTFGENNFVLQCEDGSYYFMSNPSRIRKLDHLNQRITVEGEIGNKQSIARHLYRKKPVARSWFMTWTRRWKI